MSALDPLAQRDGDAIFEEAWQAQALGLADCLGREGVFSAGDWAEVLGVAVRENEDTTEGYYRAVLLALERLLDRGAVPGAEVEARRDAWARAYEATPHGAPVELAAGEWSLNSQVGGHKDEPVRKLC